QAAAGLFVPPAPSGARVDNRSEVLVDQNWPADQERRWNRVASGLNLATKTSLAAVARALDRAARTKSGFCGSGQPAVDVPIAKKPSREWRSASIVCCSPCWRKVTASSAWWVGVAG